MMMCVTREDDVGTIVVVVVVVPIISNTDGPAAERKKSAPTPDVHQTPYPTLIPALAGGLGESS